MGLKETGVTSGFVIVALFKNGMEEGVIGRDIDATFVNEDSGFDLPVSEAGTEWEGNILVHGLECL